MSETSGRSPVGRVSFFWAAGCACLVGMAVFGERLAKPGGAGARFLAAHGSVALVLGAGCAVFFVIYALLERTGRLRPKASMGRAHAGATLLGVALMLLPASFLSGLLTSPTLVYAAVGGYLLTLLAQALFVPVLLDAFRPRPDLR